VTTQTFLVTMMEGESSQGEMCQFVSS